MCNNGYTIVSWILVIIPIVLLFLLIIFGIVALNKLNPEQIDKILYEDRKD
jgi:purine-cytosine permease-like protein